MRDTGGIHSQRKDVFGCGSHQLVHTPIIVDPVLSALGAVTIQNGPRKATTTNAGKMTDLNLKNVVREKFGDLQKI